MIYKGFADLFVLFVLVGAVNAANRETSPVLTNHRLVMEAASARLYDGYLSTLPYTGWGLGLNYTTSRYPTASTDRMYMQEIDMRVLTVDNPAGTAGIESTNLNYDRGVLFVLPNWRGLKAAVGPMLDLGYGMNYQSRNVNNPFNLNLWMDACVAAHFTYDIPWVFTRLRVKADLRTSLIGCQFAPLRGESYYEMFTFMNFNQAVHFTSWHNKQAWSMRYTVDIPLPYAVFTLGVAGASSAFAANSTVFGLKTWSVSMGCTFDVALFAGNRRPAPAGFIPMDR